MCEWVHLCMCMSGYDDCGCDGGCVCVSGCIYVCVYVGMMSLGVMVGACV